MSKGYKHIPRSWAYNREQFVAHTSQILFTNEMTEAAPIMWESAGLVATSERTLTAAVAHADAFEQWMRDEKNRKESTNGGQAHLDHQPEKSARG